jgi:class 3 adenylate cyclase/tetratricopeptide (TPR) repeat protein
MSGPDRPGYEAVLEEAADAATRGEWAMAGKLAEAVLSEHPEHPAARSLASAARRQELAGGEFERTERRRLTVMFSDLVGSTAMSAALDPEEIEDIVGDYYAAFSSVIAGFGGHVGKHLGDGLLVFFGHPTPHEDHAVRAALAGLEMIDAVKGLSQRVERRYGVELAVRVGIHTGTVVLSEIGGQGALDAFGATPNLAARVQGEAPRNTVVVSDDTSALLGDRFELEPLEAAQLKGIGREMPLFRVVRPVRVDVAARGRRDLVPLVGRERERIAMEDALNRAAAGDSEVLLIRGDAGIGKTKLAAHLRDRCEARDGNVVTLLCSPFHEHSVFSPIRRLVEDAAGLRDGDDEETRRERLAAFVGGSGGGAERLYVLEMLLGLPPRRGAPSLTPQRLRELTFTVLADWIGSLTEPGLLLVLIEDLQWVDPSTLELLSRIAEQHLPRTLVAITSRPAGALPADVHAETIVLEPMSVDEVERLVANLDPDLALESRQTIAGRCAGIPLFAEELVRMFGRAGEAQALAEQVPPSLQDLFQSRLGDYPTERPLVDLLATLGESATLPLLRDLTGKGDAELRTQLDALVDGHILRVDGADRSLSYSFEHVLLADAAYDQQLRRRRREIHRRLAVTLEARYRELGERGPDVVAHHYEQAGYPLEAARYWLEAGRSSGALAAYREAREHYRRGLAIKQEFPMEVSDEIELDLQIARGITLLALEGYTSDEAGRAFDRARELCHTVDDPHRLYRNLLGLWIYHSVRGNHRLGSELCDELVAAAQTVGEDNLILSAVGTKGFQDAFQGGFSDAIVRLSQTADQWLPGTIAPEMPQDPGVASWACRAAVHWVLGQPVEARRAAERAAAEAETLEPPTGPFTRAFVYGYLVWYGELARDLDYAAAAAQRSLEVASEHGFVSWIGSAYNHLGMVQCLSSAPGAGVELLSGALGLWRGAGAELYVPYYLGGLAEAFVSLGRPDDALATVAEALQKAEQLDERFYEAELHRVRGDALLARHPDAPERARHEYTESLAIARRQHARGFELRTLIALYRLDLVTGQRPQSEEALRGALERFLSRPDEPIVASALAALDGVT